MRHFTVLAAVCIAILLYVLTRVHLLSVEMNWLRSHLVHPPEVHPDGVEEFSMAEGRVQDPATESVNEEYTEARSINLDDDSEDDDADDRALEEIRKLSAIAALVESASASPQDMRGRFEEVMDDAADDASVELELDEGPPP